MPRCQKEATTKELYGWYPFLHPGLLEYKSFPLHVLTAILSLWWTVEISLKQWVIIPLFPLHGFWHRVWSQQHTSNWHRGLPEAGLFSSFLIFKAPVAPLTLQHLEKQVICILLVIQRYAAVRCGDVAQLPRKSAEAVSNAGFSVYYLSHPDWQEEVVLTKHCWKGNFLLDCEPRIAWTWSFFSIRNIFSNIPLITI